MKPGEISLQQRIARRIVFAALLPMATSWTSLTSADDPKSSVDFNRDVRPILSENCFKCHGPDAAARQAQLRLDTREGATTKHDGTAAVVPEDPNRSELLKRVSSGTPDGRMPPPETGKILKPEEIEILRRWIAEGAVYSRHWSFEPIQHDPPPDVRNALWARNAIDRFVLSHLEAHNIAPSPQANPRTLIRRLYLDLLGLSPPPDEVDLFVSDSQPNSYDHLVNRLLSNPHFGERWGRHWLDQARYADSHGYSNDAPRSMWPYRDWVLEAFNADLPFDRFTIEQLAGDLLPGATQEQVIATGFHRNTLINTEGGTKADQFRVEQAKDRVDTTAVVWLGLTVGCAKCHTHKYDPIRQSEYYELYAFFNSTSDRNSVAPVLHLPTPSQTQEIADLEDRVAELKKLRESKDSRDTSQDTEETGDPELEKLEGELEKLRKSVPTTMILQELDKPRPTHIHIRGDFLRPGEEVETDVPDALPGIVKTEGQATRLDLARWLVRSNNPLTARVRVNRIWMRLFGRGLVETENDFGTQGSRPSHPALLDWLAAKWMSQGWSTKALIRTIVTSSTYRQSSNSRPELHETDPQNVLLARQSRLRVEAEIVRDLTLSASGLLSSKLGGPGVFPPQPSGIYAFTQNKRPWNTSTGADRYRRGMYTFFYRAAPHPMFSTFDVPKFNETCTRRERSNTPLQSLAMANDAAQFEMTQFLAQRVLQESGDANDAERIHRLFLLCLGRPPIVKETRELLDYLERQRGRFRARPEDAERIRPDNLKTSLATTDAAAWTGVARVVLNLDEFITRE